MEQVAGLTNNNCGSKNGDDHVRTPYMIKQFGPSYDTKSAELVSTLAVCISTQVLGADCFIRVYLHFLTTVLD